VEYVNLVNLVDIVDVLGVGVCNCRGNEYFAAHPVRAGGPAAMPSVFPCTWTGRKKVRKDAYKFDC
jgi:hypothetical protein